MDSPADDVVALERELLMPIPEAMSCRLELLVRSSLKWTFRPTSGTAPT